MEQVRMDRKVKRRIVRLLALLLGAGVGIAVFVLLGGTEGKLEPHVEKVIAVLPAEIGEKRQELLGYAQPADQDRLEASGIIQAEQVLIASEFGGRIAFMPVDEGENVAAGDLLVWLDTALLDARIEAAEALVAVAEAGLAQAQAGVRPGQIAVARAQLAQAEAGRAAATQAISDTMALVENPQDIRLQIAVTYAQAQAAEHRVAQAEALRDAVEIAKNKFEDLRNQEGRHTVEVARGSVDNLPVEVPAELVDAISEITDGTYSYENWKLHVHNGSYELYAWKDVSLPLELHLIPNQWWQAWVGVNAAAAELAGIQSSLYHLSLQQEHPQLLEAQVDEALGALAQAEAQVALAQAQLDGLQAGASEEQLAALEARLAQAQAAVASLEQMRAMMEIRSPLDGAVVSISAYPGEVAAQGAPILTIADLDDMSLVVYVAENRIGQVNVGERVQIMVDSFPGRPFAGTVSRIADQAEFTPRNVATREERVNLVFAVEIEVANEDGALKPGMPADVLFGVDE